MSESKYFSVVEFKPAGDSPTGKTKRWDILSRGDKIGRVYWYGGWRKYVFQIDDAMYFDSSFLTTVANFLERANLEHKNNG